MRLPYAIQGALFLPALVGLLLILKAFCPAAADGSCFADFFATPIFLPLVALYKLFGAAPPFNGQEFVFIFLYWALIGMLVGLLADMFSKRDPYNPQSPYSPSQRPPL